MTHFSRAPKQHPPLYPLSPGASLTLNLWPETTTAPSRPYTFSCTVLEPFLPFTNSQALKVRVDESSSTLPLPNIIVLKLFDRRFMDRAPCERARAPAVEPQLHTAAMEMKHGTRADFSLRDKTSEYIGSEDTAEWEPWMHEVRVWERGLQFRDRERAAYRALHSLQGTAIPRLYGWVQVVDAGEDLPPILHRPVGLALEWIDGRPIRTLRRGVDVSNAQAERICQGALRTARQLRMCGVLHNDIRAANIIVRTRDLAPFLIDFGHCAMNEEGRPEEEWHALVTQNGEIEAMRVCLAQDGLHLPTPHFDILRDPWRGHARGNVRVEQGDPAWREKYWMRVERAGPDFVVCRDEQGREHRYEFQRWELRPGVRSTHESDDQ